MNAVSEPRPLPVPPRFLALSFPRLSTDRIWRERLGRSWRSAHDGQRAPALPPLALYERDGNADWIVALCEIAAAGGLARGTSLAEARARFPGLQVGQADPAADAHLLEAIADGCERYTPLVALDPPQGLILDISGCAHLFGGEESLLADVLSRLFRQGLAAEAAVAAHAGTALALVRHRPGAIAAGGEEAGLVAPLSVGALRLEPDLTAILLRLGLKRIGDLTALPRASLAKRFGAELLTRLDQALGRTSRPITPRQSVPALTAERRLFEPVSRIEDVLDLLHSLAIRLKEDLEQRDEGARRLELALFRVDGKVERIRVAASAPCRAPERIGRLFDECIKGSGDELDAGFGYDLVKLSVLEAAPMPAVQADLSDGSGNSEALCDLIDRLGARLGEESVLRIEPVESHWPERAARLRPACGTAPGGKKAIDPASMPAPRPLRLLAVPEIVEATFEVPDGVPIKFRWRRALHVVRRAEGPERIEPEWWRAGTQRMRDYYRIEDEAGRRYWLFREERLGEEAGNGGLPVWYLHGIFA